MLQCHRHPDAVCRPSFQDIVTALHANDKYVLEVPPEDAMSHSEAGRLGAPIECGTAMYQDLCNQYVGHSPVYQDLCNQYVGHSPVPEESGDQLCNDYDVVVMD